MSEQQQQAERFRAASPEVGLNLHRYFQTLTKRKWLILSVFLAVMGAAAVWTFSRTWVYQATATVLVERKAPQVLGDVKEVVDLSTESYWRNKEYMETQKTVINSKATALKVAQRLQLAPSPAFWGASWEKFTRRGVRPTANDAADQLRKVIKAAPVRESNILEISVEHPDPALAARLANEVAQAYLEHNVEYKQVSTTGALKWLADQLDELKKQLETSEMALYNYKKKYNIISISLEDRQSILARQIEKMTDALTEASVKRMGISALRRQVQGARGPSADPLRVAVQPVTDSFAIQQLKATYAEELRKYNGLRERYLDRHPLVAEQRARMEVARAAVTREITNVLDAVEAKYREAVDNEGQIAAALQRSKAEALELNRQAVPYQRLKRNEENNSKLYSMVLTRIKETDLTAQLRVNNIRLLDAALAPRTPVRPRVTLNMIFGAILGIFLGIGLAFLVDTLDSSVKSQDDVEQVAGVVFLGLMPQIAGNALKDSRGRESQIVPELVVHRDPKSAVAESCRSIRTNLHFASADVTLRTMMVTSPAPQEGKTTTAVSVAIAIAQAGSRVLIVDTDMRRPRLHRVFGVPGSEGITSVLLGDGKLEDVIKSTEVPGLYVLPCGPIPPNPAELCQSTRFHKLVEELKERFDRVILDSPPIMLVTDAVVLSTLVDGTLMVARIGRTSRAGLGHSVRRILDVGAPVIGVVLNDVDLTRDGYGYYRYGRHGYYRYGAYRYGYGEHEEKAS
ncbi:MAG: polysaccharide biosynthesis tyrosine autokinase [Deltaproteobacteria bacterium]|nr:polysaccharide biosynthesis tyrosine autokinase [Deltaproteobacteria bacterium]